MPEVRRVAGSGLLLLPAALVLYFAFNSGGFHPAAPAYVAVVLCVILALRAALAAHPLAGLSPSLALAAAGLGLYSLLALVSGAWSHAPGVARVESDLPLVYLLVMLVGASIGHTRGRLRWTVRALAAATVAACACGLLTRLLPRLWPTSPGIAGNRLSFPVTYWNVLGLLATVGIVLCLHLTSDLREPRGSRVAGAAAIPLLATTLFFTFSRGAIAAALIAVLAYVLVGRPLGLLSSALAVFPATAIAIKLSYDANLLAGPDATSAAAIVQGKHLALTVADCVLGAAIVRIGLIVTMDKGLKRVRLSPRLRRQAAWAGWTSAALVAVILGFAVRGTIVSDYHRFLSSAGPGSGSDLRSRLTDPANNGRIDMWRVAWDGFKSTPVVGHGAGTFANTWAQQRSANFSVRDAHSLYLETLDELGVVGLALLLVPVLAVLARVALRARGRGRSLYAAVFAVLIAWALQAGIDWDWEMPVVTTIFFALGGLVLARRLDRPTTGGRIPWSLGVRDSIRSQLTPSVSRRLVSRTMPAVALMALAVVPAYIWVSQARLDDAAYLFAQGDCVHARNAAESSISVLGDRAEPYEILGYCDLRLGSPRAALAAINKAVSLDPENWNYAYSLALIRAAAGLNPHDAARRSLALNPRDPMVQAAWQTFHSGRPREWRAEGMAMAESLTTL